MKSFSQFVVEGRAIGFDENPWKFSAYRNAPNLQGSIKSVADAKEIRRKLGSRLNNDGRTVTVYHVTDSDNVKNILQHGLIPGASAAPGQPWQADHSKFATYFHCDLSAAERDIEQANEHEPGAFVIIEADIPITPKSLIRILPDEDSASDPNDGLKTFMNGEAIAYIGGVPASAVRLR